MLHELNFYIIDKEKNKNQKNSLRKLTKIVKEKTKTTVSHVTVRKGLQKLELRAFIPTKKASLTKKHISMVIGLLYNGCACDRSK